MKKALRNGEEIHISSITEDERGLKCKCKCPECGELMEAQKEIGDSGFQDRFKHSSGSECHMSQLHVLAQEIIQDSSWIFLPNDNISDYLNPRMEHQLENGMRADNYVSTTDGDIAIEIVVTNPPSAMKIKYYTECNFMSIQITLYPEKYRSLNKRKIRRAVLSEKDTREWIKEPKEELPTKSKSPGQDVGWFGGLLVILGLGYLAKQAIDYIKRKP